MILYLYVDLKKYMNEKKNKNYLFSLRKKQYHLLDDNKVISVVICRKFR